MGTTLLALTLSASAWILGRPYIALVCTKVICLITQSRIYSGAQPIVSAYILGKVEHLPPCEILFHSLRFPQNLPIMML